MGRVRKEQISDADFVDAVELASTGTPSGGDQTGIRDTGGYYTSTDVEAVLQELGADNKQRFAYVTMFHNGIAFQTINSASWTAFGRATINLDHIPNDVGYDAHVYAKTQAGSDGDVRIYQINGTPVSLGSVNIPSGSSEQWFRIDLSGVGTSGYIELEAQGRKVTGAGIEVSIVILEVER